MEDKFIVYRHSSQEVIFSGTEKECANFIDEYNLWADVEILPSEEFSSATEGFPKEFKDWAERTSYRNKFTDDGDYARDSEGKIVRELDKKRLSLVLKNWAKKWADHGISVNDLNFDEYLLEGVTIDKAPTGCVTVVMMSGNDFYIKDKRHGQPARWWEEGSARLSHPKKGYRDISKVPDSYIFQEAKRIWVIPEEDFTTDVDQIRKDRREKAVPREFIRRRDKAGQRISYTNKYYDKSGYLIDPYEIDKKFDKLRQKRLAGDNLIDSVKAKVEEFTNEYNSIARVGFDLIHSLLISGKEVEVDDTNFLRYCSRIKQGIKEVLDDLSSYSGLLASELEPGEKDYYEKRLIQLPKNIKEVRRRYLDDLKRELKSLETIKASATESFSGLFISEEFLKKIGED